MNYFENLERIESLLGSGGGGAEKCGNRIDGNLEKLVSVDDFGFEE